MSRSKKRNKSLMFAANMPPLYHTIPGEDFNYKNSEVLKWISERPALLNYVFTQASNAKEIIYNPETRMWQGVDWEGE